MVDKDVSSFLLKNLMMQKRKKYFIKKKKKVRLFMSCSFINICYICYKFIIICISFCRYQCGVASFHLSFFVFVLMRRVLIGPSSRPRLRRQFPFSTSRFPLFILFLLFFFLFPQVFGFLGFTGFLAGLVWEVMVWLKNRDSGPGFATATVVSGLDRR